MKIQQVESIGNLVAHGYTEFGGYINTKRVLPHIMDGLKPSYRRAIFSTYEIDPGFSTTHEVLGYMSRFHPHSTDGTEDVMSNLCRYGILQGKGNHGRKDILGVHDNHAAPRYTKIKVPDSFKRLIDPVISLVPHSESEVNPKYKEPDYLPVPIPLSLTFDRLSGLGIGVSTVYPTFSMKSLLDAYLANDPNLLEYREPGLKINKSESNLQGLWDKGYGHVVYEYDVKKFTRDVMVTGNPSRFPISLGGTSNKDDIYFDQLLSESKVLIENLSDKNNPGLLRVSLAPGVRVDMDWLYEYLLKKARHRETYYIRVTDGSKVYSKGIREWIDFTYNNYLNLLNTNKQNRLDKLNLNRKVYDVMPAVVDYFLKNPDSTNEQIAKKTKVDVELVKLVMAKTISSLRKTDSINEIKKIDDKINEINNFDPKNFILNNIL
jgi:hypothetical protein